MNLRDEALNQGLTEQEYHEIIRLLNREPNSVELAIFAVMWSEHCSYKTTKKYLRTLPTKNEYVVQGPGENAGIIHIGQETCVAFKVESHNHPSFIEPFQGAATGVGGILRDVFTMGARPVAILDSLHFGEVTNERTPYLFHGVVGGISHYGNCIGIPTVGGEVHFDSSYNGNNLVNAMAVGICKRSEIYKAKAEGEENLVVYLGPKTGKDGIHGATMASEEFDEESEEKRPTVQVGDPFMEKLVMETTLEMLKQKLVVGIQDMGAAGIACSTFEMSYKSQSGMDIDLDKIPLREEDTTAYQIFLSESQERMLMVVEPAKLHAVMDVANKWDVPCAVVGKVTSTGRVRAFKKHQLVVDLPVNAVCEGFIEFNRPWTKPVRFLKTLDPKNIQVKSIEDTILTMISSPNLSSRRAVYERYDYTVGADTVQGPGADAAILRIKDTRQKIAVTIESNNRYCFSDPFIGTCHTVAEAVRNLACVGAKGIALTNCLNFGNPQDTEVMGQIKESIEAIGNCAKHFNTPVTGGNVSLYNQTNSQNIHPTPTIGMVGLVEHDSKVSSFFTKEGLKIAVVGKLVEDKIYQSEFAHLILKEKELQAPPISLTQESSLQEFLLSTIAHGWIETAHDCSQGGLVQTLVEAVVPTHAVGAVIVKPNDAEVIPFLFGEYASRAVIAFDSKKQSQIETLCKELHLPFTVIGQTKGTALEIQHVCMISKQELFNKRDSFLEDF